MAKTNLSENNLNRIISESIKKVIKEDIYDDQWENEKKMFFDALESGEEVFYDTNTHTLYVRIYNDGDDRDPRYVSYEIGDDHLEDDHFCMQNSPKLTEDELYSIAAHLDYNIESHYPNDTVMHDFIDTVIKGTEPDYERGEGAWSDYSEPEETRGYRCMGGFPRIGENSIRNAVKAIVKEQVENYINGLVKEDKEAENKKKKEISATKRKQVLKLLNQDKVDMAAIARKLYPDMGEDTRRSLISKKSRGERPLNDYEATVIYQMLRTTEN